MKRVAYHRLAARELIESALFYDQRRMGLGEELLNEVEALLQFIRAHAELGRQGPHGTRSFPMSIVVETRKNPFEQVWDNDADDVFNHLAAMAKDPQIQRELWPINAEFAAAESDGLGRQAEIGGETFAA